MVQIPSWHYFDSAEVKGVWTAVVVGLLSALKLVTKKVPVVILS